MIDLRQSESIGPPSFFGVLFLAANKLGGQKTSLLVGRKLNTFLRPIRNGLQTSYPIFAHPGVTIELTLLGTGCNSCLLYTSPSPRDRTRSRMPSSA